MTVELFTQEQEVPDLFTKEAEEVTDTVVRTGNVVASNRMNGDEGLYDTFLRYEEVRKTQGQEALTDLLNEEYQETQRQIHEPLMEEALMEGADPALEAAQAINEATLQDDEDLQSDWKNEALQYKTIKNSFDRAEYVNAHLKKRLHQYMKDYGLLEKAGDFLGFMIPDFTIELSEFTGAPLTQAADAFMDGIYEFASLPHDERIARWDGMLEHAKEVTQDLGTENKLKFFLMMSRYLDPSSAQEEVNLESFLDAVDALLLTTEFFSGAVKVAKGYTTIKRLEDLGATDEAAKISVASLADKTGNVAETTGVSVREAIHAADPFAKSEAILGSTDNLAAKVTISIEDIEKSRNVVQDQFKGIFNKTSYNPERLLAPEDALTVQNKALDNVDDLVSEIQKDKGYYIQSAAIKDSDELGFHISYDMMDGNGNRAYSASHRVDYTLDDVGNVKTDVKLAPVKSRVYSPETWVPDILRDAVSQATRLNFAQERLGEIFEKTINLATKNLSVRSKRNVDTLLLQGDEAEGGLGKLYTLDDFNKGIVVKGADGVETIMHYSPEEIKSYYALRDVFDGLHFLANRQVKESLTVEGHKYVKLSDDLAAFGKPFKQANHVPAPLVNNKDFRIFDGRTGALANSHKLNIPKMYEQGYVVTKFRKPVAIGDELVEYGLVETSKVGRIPNNVLNYKAGYVPRIYTDGYYFVKKVAPATKNGQKDISLSTLRVFDNATEAKRWADKQTELNSTKGVEFKVAHDRENVLEVEEGFISNHGGLITSSRSENALLMGEQGRTAGRESAMSSLSRAVQKVSTQVPLNEFRLAKQQEWVNLAKSMNAFEHPEYSHFNSTLNRALDPDKLRALERSRDWIRDQLRVPTEHERSWSHTLWKAAEWMEGTKVPGRDWARKKVMDIASKDPFAALRGAAFHAYLGWFNPAQLWVQAQGASIAFALDPLRAPKYLKQGLSLRSVYHAYNSPGAVKKAASLSGLEEKEFTNMLDALRRTGLLDAVNRSNADFAAGTQIHNKSMGWDTFKNVAGKGLTFFTEGERFTRGYAFVEAYNRFMRGRKGTGALSNDELRTVLDDTLHRMLNLTRANRAHWQKGAWSVPTQFLQYTAKFSEAMGLGPGLGKHKFSPNERFRILLGQSALYGAAGVPMGRFLLEEYGHYAGKDVGTMSSEEKAFWTDGIQGFAVAAMTGQPVELASRGAGMAGVEDIVTGILDVVNNKTDVPEAIFGASQGVGSQMWEAFKYTKPMFFNPTEIEWTKKEMLTVLDYWTDTISSMRNFSKAYAIYNTGRVTDRFGNPVFAGLKEPGDVWKAQKWKTFKDETKRTFSKEYTKLMNNYFASASVPSQEDIKNFEIRAAGLAKIMNISDSEFNELRKNAHKRFFEDETKLEKLRSEIVPMWLESSDDFTRKGLTTNQIIDFTE